MENIDLKYKKYKKYKFKYYKKKLLYGGNPADKLQILINILNFLININYTEEYPIHNIQYNIIILNKYTLNNIIQLYNLIISINIPNIYKSTSYNSNIKAIDSIHYDTDIYSDYITKIQQQNIQSSHIYENIARITLRKIYLAEKKKADNNNIEIKLNIFLLWNSLYNYIIFKPLYEDLYKLTSNTSSNIDIIPKQKQYDIKYHQYLNGLKFILDTFHKNHTDSIIIRSDGTPSSLTINAILLTGGISDISDIKEFLTQYELELDMSKSIDLKSKKNELNSLFRHLHYITLMLDVMIKIPHPNYSDKYNKVFKNFQSIITKMNDVGVKITHYYPPQMNRDYYFIPDRIRKHTEEQMPILNAEPDINIDNIDISDLISNDKYFANYYARSNDKICLYIDEICLELINYFTHNQKPNIDHVQLYDYISTVFKFIYNLYYKINKMPLSILKKLLKDITISDPKEILNNGINDIINEYNNIYNGNMVDFPDNSGFENIALYN